VRKSSNFSFFIPIYLSVHACYFLGNFIKFIYVKKNKSRLGVN
jgi:hypothetical protein